ncbi:HEPN domain-containing protein [soil metagenome]
MLDHDEFVRWLEASDDEAALAAQLVDLAAFNAVVLHSEQAAQLMLKGLLRGVGAAREAWGHALAELADRTVATTGLALTDDLRGRLTTLARDYMPTRYPDALTSGTPRDNYTTNDATRALDTRTQLRAAVVETWERLVAEQGDDEVVGRSDG